MKQQLEKNGSYANEGHNWFNYQRIGGIDSLNGYLGTKAPGNYCTWESDADGIMGFGYYISHHPNLYFSQGVYTVEEIGKNYCTVPPPPIWANNVKGYMMQLYEAAGITITSESDITSNGNFLEIALECHNYLADNGFEYAQSNEVPYPNGTKVIDCSAYVTWVLYEYGYTEFKGHQKVSYQFKNMAYSGYNGWQVIPIESIQPGDLVFSSKPFNHIEIYAGERQCFKLWK